MLLNEYEIEFMFRKIRNFRNLDNVHIRGPHIVMSRTDLTSILRNQLRLCVVTSLRQRLNKSNQSTDWLYFLEGNTWQQRANYRHVRAHQIKQMKLNSSTLFSRSDNCRLTTICCTIVLQGTRCRDLDFFCVGVMYSGEYDVCDVTLSVYPRRASLKNMPGHGGNRAYTTFGILAQCSSNWATRSGRFQYVIFRN